MWQWCEVSEAAVLASPLAGLQLVDQIYACADWASELRVARHCQYTSDPGEGNMLHSRVTSYVTWAVCDNNTLHRDIVMTSWLSSSYIADSHGKLLYPLPSWNRILPSFSPAGKRCVVLIINGNTFPLLEFNEVCSAILRKVEAEKSHKNKQKNVFLWMTNWCCMLQSEEKC